VIDAEEVAGGRVRAAVGGTTTGAALAFEVLRVGMRVSWVRVAMPRST
jgi:hypothetical protein